jgi:hypothetical protein
MIIDIDVFLSVSYPVSVSVRFQIDIGFLFKIKIGELSTKDTMWLDEFGECS